MLPERIRLSRMNGYIDMEKFFNYLTEKKNTVFFMLGTLAFWVIMTIAALAVLEHSFDGMVAVWIILIASFYLPAAAFLASGIVIRIMGNKKPLPVILSFVLELAESAMPLLFSLIDLRKIWDYPASNWLLQAGISAGTFIFAFLVTHLIMNKKGK